MKKILVSLGIIISFLFVNNVKADMAAPEVMKFEAFVSNKNGAKVYEDDKVTRTLPYNTKIKIGYSTEVEGKIFYDISDDNMYGYVLKEDITVIKKEVKKEEGIKLEKKHTYKVLEKDGINMYKGPNNQYFDKVEGGIIPYGATFTTDIGDVEDGVWEYVTYNGKSGWVSIHTMGSNSADKEKDYNNKLAIPNNDKFMIALNKLKLCEEDLETCTTISAKENDEIKSSYYLFTAPRNGSYYYVEYNGKKGWVNSGITTSIDNVTKIITLKNIDIYDTYSKNKKIGSIPANTEINEIAIYYDFENDDLETTNSYIEYNGIKGWISTSYEDVKYDNEEEVDENIKETEEDIEDSKEEIHEDIEEDNKIEDIEKEVINPKKETNKYIVICIGGAIVLAFTSVVIIVLINKKKKNKNNEIDVEDTVSTVNEKVETQVEEVKAKVCPNCGKEVIGNFCDECGTKLN